MKTLRFLLINFFVKDHNKTLSIIESIDGKKKDTFYEPYQCDMSSWLQDDEEDCVYKPLVVEKSTSPQKKTKKDELMEGLSYLKSKPNKSIKDKESIYTLEMLLKNMS